MTWPISQVALALTSMDREQLQFRASEVGLGRVVICGMDTEDIGHFQG